MEAGFMLYFLSQVLCRNVGLHAESIWEATLLLQNRKNQATMLSEYMRHILINSWKKHGKDNVEERKKERKKERKTERKKVILSKLYKP